MYSCCLCVSGWQRGPPAVLQRGRGEVLCDWSDKLWGQVWSSSQARRVRQNQQVYRLAEDGRSDSISVGCTQTEHETDLSSAQCCSDAVLKHPAINVTIAVMHRTVLISHHDQWLNVSFNIATSQCDYPVRCSKAKFLSQCHTLSDDDRGFGYLMRDFCIHDLSLFNK